jgi:hypothetical protein
MIVLMSRVRPSLVRTAALLLALAVAASMPVSATGTCVMGLLRDVASTAEGGQVCTMAQCPMHGQKMSEAPARTRDWKCCQMSDGSSAPAVPLRPVTTVRTLPEATAGITPPTAGRVIDSASTSLSSLDPALDPRPPRSA